MDYNHKTNYCGPGQGPLNKIIPNEFFGVSFNQACYLHDNGYASNDRRKQEDIMFLYRMYQAIEVVYPNKGYKRTLLRAIAKSYYLAVRSLGWMFKKETQ